MRLEVQSASFGYVESEPILKDISFTANDGDLIAILGPNGAGKTTLLRCMMDFLQWNTGKTLLDNEDVRKISSKNLWQKISYVPQARNTSSSYTVTEAVLLGRNSRLSPLAIPKAEDIDITFSLLEKLHIQDIKDKKCNELSGGQQQMVLIARALASNPGILILDEPESNLDFRNQLIILETMSELVSNNMICIFNTHYPAHALQRANKSILLSKNGSYIAGNTHDIITESNISAAFGVNTVIGEVETPENIMKNITAVSLSNDSNTSLMASDNNISKIAIISILTTDYTLADTINSILHEYSEYLIGRMGMPYKKGSVHIINVTLDAPMQVTDTLVLKLQALKKTSVKATYAYDEDAHRKDDE